MASAVDLLNQANKWTPIVADVLRGRSIVGEHFKLEKDAFNATHYPVPPKPENLLQERVKLVRMLGTSKQAEVRIKEMMRSLEEQSHAFWGR